MSDEPRWYSVNTIGMATLCRGEADARREAADADAMWPRHAPHVATQLVPMAEIDRLRARVADGFDLIAHLTRQREFSERTFGPGVRTKGVVDHIRKELIEIEAKPDDLSEWVDVILLALDGAWRTGHTPQQICEGMTAKQVKNEARTWPDWRTADPNKAIEHDRSKDGA
jgi:hypothetical protein